MRRKLVLWFLLLIAEFLAGFIPQYARLQRLQEELSASSKQLVSCQSSETIVAAARHSRDDVSGGGAKELRKGRGVLERVF